MDVDRSMLNSTSDPAIPEAYPIAHSDEKAESLSTAARGLCGLQLSQRNVFGRNVARETHWPRAVHCAAADSWVLRRTGLSRFPSHPVGLCVHSGSWKLRMLRGWKCLVSTGA